MQRLPSDVLSDPMYRVPHDSGAAGVSWLRGNVARFCEGDDHVRRRALIVELLAAAADAPFVGSPARTLLAARGLPAELEPDVAVVAAAYQPHAPQSAEADAACDRLVAAAGGRTERAAAVVCVLVQAHAGCAGLAEKLRSGRDGPPLPVTRRVTAGGETVEVDLVDAPFGRGAHRCPGKDLGTRLASEAAAE